MMNTTNSSYYPPTNRKWVTVLLIITIAGILSYTSDFTNYNYNNDEKVNDKTKIQQQISIIQDSMKKDFYIARDKIIEKLKQQYGSDLFHKMFVVENDDTMSNSNSNNNNNNNTHQRFRTLFDGNDNNNNINNNINKVYNDKYMSSLQSYNRMVRKVMKKIIQAQIQLYDTKETTPIPAATTTTTLQSASGNSFIQESSEQRIQHEQNDLINDDNNNDDNSNSIESTLASLIPFIWVTAGNSVAAGHGNLYNESYSAVVERNVQSMFQTVFNMNLIIRNYGISAMVSAPEASLCLNEIYGTDIDLLLWHFGLTDDTQYHNLALFLYRSLLHRSHPAVWALYVDGNTNGKHRRNIIHVLEEQYNLCVLTMNSTVFNNIQDCIPDTFGLSDDEINVLPEYVRNFRCGKQIESGDPYCTNERFSSYYCPNREYQESWHPGWKWNALLGNLATFTLLQVLEDAIIEIEKYMITANDNIKVLYETLLQEEQDAFQNSLEKTPPIDLLRPFIDETMINDTTLSFLAQSQSICRTGLYPSESRIKGIVQLNNNNNEGMITSIEKSVPQRENWDITTGYITDYDCQVPTAIDHRDYYRVDFDDSWKTLVLPSQSEMNAYFYKFDTSTSTSTLSSSTSTNNNKKKKLHGYIAVCTMVYCRGCPNNLLKRTALYNNSISIQVNGIIVTNFTKFSDCDLLYHDINRASVNMKQQSMVFPANENGQYEISIKVNKQATYYPISSIVLW